ncbi:MAG: sugar phosphate isomerase/epimerase [Treponema sp.]|nr:sugar phosphate isomerase/epimerase [Treponema sp.]
MPEFTDRRKPLQIGLRAHDYGAGVTIEELAETLDVYKPSSIQLALSKALKGAPPPGGLSPAYARRIRKVLEEKNIAIAVLGCYINPIHPDKIEREKQLYNFEEHLRYARDFNCAMVGTETGSCNADCSFHPDTEKQESFDLLCESLERLVTTAEKCGSIAAIEAVADIHTISTIEKMEALQRRLASPALKVIYDPVNLIPNAGLAETQKEFFLRAFSAFGGKITTIHAKDFRMENGLKNGRYSAGLGEMDYPALLSVIMKEKPDIDILLEDTSPSTGKQAMEFLQETALKYNFYGGGLCYGKN